MTIFVCLAGHLVRAEHSQVSIDSICPKCKANQRRQQATAAKNAAPGDVEHQVSVIVNTSVQDGISSAWHASIAVIRRAIHVEQSKETPRVSLIRGLTTELRKKERAAAAEPKDAA